MRDYPENWDEIRRQVYARDGYCCRNCGRGNVELHCHHIVPLSKGGTNRLDNLVTLCVDCHTAVHNDVLAPTAYAPRDDSSGSGLVYALYTTYKKFRNLF